MPRALALLLTSAAAFLVVWFAWLEPGGPAGPAGGLDPVAESAGGGAAEPAVGLVGSAAAPEPVSQTPAPEAVEPQAFHFFVREAQSRKPVEGVVIALERTGHVLGATDDDGRLVVEHAAPVVGYTASRDGYVTGRGRVLANHTVTIHLRRGVPLKGRVLAGFDARPVEGAVVELVDLDDDGLTRTPARTDELGGFGFEAVRPFHPFRVRVTAEGFLPYVREDLIEGALDDYDIRIGIGRVLEGVVVGPDEKPIEGALVMLLPDDRPMPPYATQWPGERDRSDAGEILGIAVVQVGADGRFRFEGAPWTPQRIVVRIAGRYRTHAVIRPGTGPARVVVPPLAEADVTVMVRGVGMVEGARFLAVTRYDCVRPQVVVQGAGRYRLSGLVPTQTRLEIRFREPPGFARTSLVFESAKRIPVVNVEVDPASAGPPPAQPPPPEPEPAEGPEPEPPDAPMTTVTGRFQPRPIATVTVRLVGDAVRDPKPLVVDAEGRFAFPGPPVGAWVTAIFETSGHAAELIEIPSLRDGDVHNLGTIRLPEGFALRGRVVGPTGRPLVGAAADVSITGFAERVRTDADGHFEFLNVPERSASVKIVAREGLERTVDVQVQLFDERQQIELGSGLGGLRGRVLYPDGTPTSGAVVTATPWKQRYQRDADASVRMAPDRHGAFVCYLAPGRYMLRMVAPGGARRRVTVQIEAGAEASVAFTARLPR